jgi:hypothetical protein
MYTSTAFIQLHLHLHQLCMNCAVILLTTWAFSFQKDFQNLLHAMLLLVQDQGKCAACVGFALTAAAEAAVNVYKQQNWQKTSLSEQYMSFCGWAYLQVPN